MNSLNLSYRDLTSLPDLTDIVDLDCSHNQLTELTNLPESLKYLEAENNQISYIDSFPEKLIIINLKNNNLKRLPQLPPKLQRLNVTFNKLVELPELPDSLRDLQCNLKFENLPILPYNLVLFVYDGRQTLNEIKLDQYNKRLQELGRPPVTTIPNNYEEWASIMRLEGAARRVVDLAMIFKGTPLASSVHSMAQLISHDVKAFDVAMIERNIHSIVQPTYEDVDTGEIKRKQPWKLSESYN